MAKNKKESTYSVPVFDVRHYDRASVEAVVRADNREKGSKYIAQQRKLIVK